MQVLQAIIDGLLIGGVYSLVAIGLTLIFGVMKIVNFAHGALLMLGMYIAYWAFTLCGLNPYLSLPVTFGLMFAVGALIQRVILQPIEEGPDHNQLLVTLGLMLILENLALLLWSPDFRSVRIPWLVSPWSACSLVFDRPRLLAFAFALCLAVALFAFLNRTLLGKAIRATAQDKEGAWLIGANVRKVKYITCGLGAACAGVAGALIAPFFYTSPIAGGAFLLRAFVIAVLGGLGSFPGAFLGGLIIGVGESLGGLFLPGTLKELITYGIFIGILLFKPNGLLGSEAAGGGR